MTGDEATLTVAGSEVVPGLTATVLTMVAPAGTLRTVGAEAGGIFWVAAAAAASAAIPLIWGLLPITCRGRTEGGHGDTGVPAMCPPALPVSPLALTVPWGLWLGTTMRTPAGSDVTVTGALPGVAAERTVTRGGPAPAAGPVTFSTAGTPVGGGRGGQRGD